MKKNTWLDFPIGTVVYAKMASPIFDYGMMGIVCEHYQGFEGEHLSVLFLNNEKEGFSPSDIDIFLTKSKLCLDFGDNLSLRPQLVTDYLSALIKQHPIHLYENFLIQEEKELLENNIKETSENKKLKI